MSAARVTLGRRTLAADQQPYVIAEAGVNHEGSVARARQMVAAAATAGADAVKFQVFRAATLVTAAAPKADYQQGSPGQTQYEMLQRLELDDDDLATLAAEARALRIDFLATPFAPDDVARLTQLDVPAIKLSSADLGNRELLDACCATRLPLILSTGAALATEIDTTVRYLDERGAHARLVLLHCVSAYPTPLGRANVAAVATLARRYGTPCGYSDHTRSLHTGGWAVAAGACVLEKHFTLDKSLPGPDQSFSLEPGELQRYVTLARAAFSAAGDGSLDAQPIEDDVRNVARRSLVARVPIAADTPLTPDLLTAKRPAGGIPPERIDEILGRTLAADLPADARIEWDLLR